MRHIIRRTAGLLRVPALLVGGGDRRRLSHPPGRAAPRQNIPGLPECRERRGCRKRRARKAQSDAGNAGEARPRCGAGYDRQGRRGCRQRVRGGTPPRIRSTGRATIRATVTAMPPDTGPPWIGTKKTIPAATPLLSSFSADDRPEAEARPQHRRGFRRSTIPRRTSFWPEPWQPELIKSAR